MGLIDIGLLPSYTTHMMQPLDVSIFKWFKCNFISMKGQFINANLAWSNGSFNKTYLEELANNALKEAFIMSNIQASFRKTGIYPLNIHAMDDECGPSIVFTPKVAIKSTSLIANNNTMGTKR